METRYSVVGMTCQHCVTHVRQEVEALDEVMSVDIDLSGLMVVHSKAAIDFSSIQDAVSEAGNYTVIACD